jgi:hypothetical protein
MEEIQMLKYGLKKACLDFTQGWVTEEAMMGESEEEAEDFLATLLGDNQAEALDSLLDVLVEEDDDSHKAIEL